MDMRRLVAVGAALLAAAMVAAGLAASAGAYGGGAGHSTWQIAISSNCNSSTSPICLDPTSGLPSLGGFWGWIEFDQWSDGSITGDAELAFCGHTTGGGGPGSAGAGHEALDIYAAHIDPDSGDFIIDSASDPNFEGDLGIPSAAGHYMDHPAPGVSQMIQVAYRAAR
jgi:hypothetical protein